MAKKSEDKTEVVQGVILCDCFFGKHDEIVELDPRTAKAAEKDGYFDPHPNAIKAVKAGQ
jgi:hypothetical protein